MKKVIALHESEYGSESILVISGSSWSDYGLIQTSKSIEVDFESLPSEEIVLNKLKMLDKLIIETREEAMQTLNSLESKKQELLALTYKADDSTTTDLPTTIVKQTTARKSYNYYWL